MIPLPSTHILNTDGRMCLLCNYHPIKNTHNNFHQSRKRPCRDGTFPVHFISEMDWGFFLNRNSAKRTAAVLTCLKICRVRKKRGLWLSQDASILNVTESMPELSSKVVFGCKRSKISKWPVLSEQSSWDWPLPLALVPNEKENQPSPKQIQRLLQFQRKSNYQHGQTHAGSMESSIYPAKEN